MLDNADYTDHADQESIFPEGSTDHQVGIDDPLKDRDLSELCY